MNSLLSGSTKNSQSLCIHFVGIGGIGMSGIAQVLVNQKYRVTGSDQSASEATKRLQEHGAIVHIGHDASYVHGADVVVISSAVRAENPELIEARKLKIPIIPRAEMLGEVMRKKTGIALAGTHGKTTTTSMVATLLTSANLDPTLIIGGKVDSFGGNAKFGTGEYVVAEADESDGSFLHLPATYGVITNIDNDHLDHFGSLEALDQAFVDFVGNLPFYGLVAVCLDDPGVRRILTRLQKPYVTYGLTEEAEVRAVDISSDGMGSQFSVIIEGKRFEPIHLKVPGIHNILNALGALSIALKLGLSYSEIQKGFKSFAGVRRRFDIRWKSASGKIQLIDDYGHHPTEIAATLAAARRFWSGPITVVFQPHRYTRTLHCKDGFIHCFRDANELILTEIYAAGEDPIEGVSSAALAEAIQASAASDQKIIFKENFQQIENYLLSKIDFENKNSEQLILCMGAGTITRFAEDLAQKFRQKALEK